MWMQISDRRRVRDQNAALAYDILINPVLSLLRWHLCRIQKRWCLTHAGAELL
jgi:hypothetical protein